MNAPIRAVHGPVARMVSDAELSDPIFYRDVKEFNRKLRIPRNKIRNWLAEHLEDLNPKVVDCDGNTVWIDLEAIEKTELDDGDVDGFVWWYKDWCKKTRSGVTPRLRCEARERVRLIATVLRMVFPKEATVWGVHLDPASDIL